MKKYLIGLLIAVLLLSAGCQTTGGESASDEPKELIVSAAASLTDVLDELKPTFEKDHGVELKISYAGSGTLQTQIEEGAPVDVFVSAAQKQMDALEEKNLIKAGSRADLLINKVVLITNVNRENPITSFEQLDASFNDKLAIGDPTNVPVGQYSQEILEKLGYWDDLSDNLIYGVDVRGVLTWIETDETDYGIVYATDAMTSDQVKILAEAPEGTHKPVIYPVAVIEASKAPNLAQQFIDFLKSDASMKVFQKYGFTPAK